MAVSEILLNVVYYVVAAAALGGGLAVALSRNIVRSAFALLTVLFAVAALYALVRADFIVAAQILIYVGGILVLIIFAIMLTHKITDVKLSNESSPGPVSVTACVSVFVLIVTGFVYGYTWRTGPKVLRKADVASPGQPPVPAELSMWQGSGRTAVEPGGTILDGFVQLRLKAPAPPSGQARAQFGLLKLKKAGEWEALPPPKPVTFAPGADGAVANFDFDRLPEGKYRWRVRLDVEGGDSPWVEYGVDKDVPDFTSEKGLTRALGRAFMGPYLLAFEVVSVLLLAALVGAAFLARKEVRE
ncbi:MAG TPA: NADH-quinone oxidoreductase subunit J [Planctomycetota bacterium]|nr:NADH-quinone oxidoreductase subunit J [Planctomycetota bacterium]